MNEKINEILDCVSDISNNYIAEKELSGSEFNLLKISKITKDEVKNCMILAELLNPSGSHGQKSKFLKSFCENVLDIDVSEEEISRSDVFREYVIDSNRRIDIVIKTPLRFIPIEVKIDAKDQKAQCSDYYNFALQQKKDIQSRVYYLTIDGHLPRGEGCIGLTPKENADGTIEYEEVVPISFREHICMWLDSILADEEIKNKTILFTQISQFADSIKEVCGKMDDELKLKIAESISESSEKMKAAVAVADSVNRAKEDLIIRFLDSLTSEINIRIPALKRILDEDDYTYNNYSAVRNYYKHKHPKDYVSPSARYIFKNIDKHLDIAFTVGIVDALWMGLLVLKDRKDTGETLLSHKELKRYIVLPNGYRDENSLFYWEWLPEHSDDASYSPDFECADELFLNLFDDEKFEKFVNECMNKISQLFDKIKVYE